MSRSMWRQLLCYIFQQHTAVETNKEESDSAFYIQKVNKDIMGNTSLKDVMGNTGLKDVTSNIRHINLTCRHVATDVAPVAVLYFPATHCSKNKQRRVRFSLLHKKG
jgi:hypothetical protein